MLSGGSRFREAHFKLAPSLGHGPHEGRPQFGHDRAHHMRHYADVGYNPRAALGHHSHHLMASRWAPGCSVSTRRCSSPGRGCRRQAAPRGEQIAGRAVCLGTSGSYRSPDTDQAAL
jgi:hypothetical protein